MCAKRNGKNVGNRWTRGVSGGKRMTGSQGRALKLESLEQRVLLAADPLRPYLLKDINVDTDDAFDAWGGAADPEFVQVGGEAFFAASDATHGPELWKTDGTATGTVMLTDSLTNDFGGVWPENFTNVDGTLFFTASDEDHGQELWKSDGTAAGTVMVKDIMLGTGGANIGHLAAMDGKLYFSADDGNSGQELWVSDGTRSGTKAVTDINTTAAGADSNPSFLVSAAGTLYFAANDGVNGNELWKSDGTATGTEMVEDINGGVGNSNPQRLTVMGPKVYFAADDWWNGNELWVSDGTPGGTRIVKDINPTGASVFANEPWVVMGSDVFFSVNDGTNGLQLWKTDGTEPNTSVVKLINATAPAGAEPSSLAVAGNTLFFAATDTVHGPQLWKTDGTETGTQIVTNYFVERPEEITAVGTTVFFAAKDDAAGFTQLWKSTGLPGGTEKLTDTFEPWFWGLFGGEPAQLMNLNGTLLFHANDGVHGYDAWKSDGTVAGTTLLKDVNTATEDGMWGVLWGTEAVAFKGETYFGATDGDHGGQLWKTDGTNSGTVMVTDFFANSPLVIPHSLTVVTDPVSGEETLFLVADDGTYGEQLWKSDGTAAGTEPLTNSLLWPWELTAMNGALFFTADDGTNGYELWTSDGTPSGTKMVLDINGGGSSSPAELTNVGGTLYFQAYAPASGGELWKSDGTAAGTALYADIDFAPTSSWPQNLTDVNGTLFFTANDAAWTGRELYTADGTPGGWWQLADINLGLPGSSPHNLTNKDGILYFAANDGGATNGDELWMSDGTPAGTALVKDINPGPTGSGITDLTKVGNNLFFAATNSTHGNELWVSDGTAAGTVMVKDINGADNSWPTNLVDADGTLYFTANDGEHGIEVWESDGTWVGTTMLEEIVPGDESANPRDFFYLNETVFFSANDMHTGFEPWILTSEPEVIGDFTGDGLVNLADLSLWIPKAFLDPSDPNFDAKFDLTGDGLVNLADLSVLIPKMFQTPAPALAENAIAKSAAVAAELRVTLETSETAGGAPLTGPIDRATDPTFFLNIYVEDLRTTPQGVTGGALDITWNPDYVEAGAITYGSDYSLFHQGTADNAANLVDEVGAATSTNGVGAGARALFASIEMTATVDGQVVFAGDASEGTATITPGNFALIGVGTEVAWSNVEFVNAPVQIGQNNPTDDQLRVTLEASETVGGTALAGPVNLNTDPTFVLNVYVEDLRTTPEGVTGGALDIAWDPDLVEAGAISYGSDYSLFQQGTIDNTTNLADEVGAATSTNGVGAGGRALFASIEMTATAVGQLTLSGNASEGTATITPGNFNLIGVGAEVDWTKVDFVDSAVSIVQNSVTDLGKVDFLQVTDLDLTSGNLYYKLESTHEGFLTFQVDVPQPADSVGFRLYDANPATTSGLTPLAESALDPDGNQRIDWPTAADAVYYVEISGNNADFDATIANLLHYDASAGVVTVHGTDGDDMFEFSAAASRNVTINSLRYRYEDAQVNQVTFAGGTGFDVAKLNDSAGDEELEAWPDRADLSNSSADSVRDFAVNVTGIESLLAYATTGGNDSAILHGSANKDKLKSYEDSLRLRALDSSFALRPKKFDTVTVDAGSSVKDIAVFNGSDGDEQFTYTGADNTARVEAPGRDHSAVGFSSVVARAGGGTGDVAHFTDIPGVDGEVDDIFYFKSHKTQLVGKEVEITVRAFDEVHATAGETGLDVARIYDTAGDEHLDVAGDAVRCYRRNGTELDLVYEALHFERVKAYSTAGDDTTDIDANHTIEDLLLYGWD